MDPLWNSLVVGGLAANGTPFLGTVGMLGTAYTDQHIATGAWGGVWGGVGWGGFGGGRVGGWGRWCERVTAGGGRSRLVGVRWRGGGRR